MVISEIGGFFELDETLINRDIGDLINSGNKKYLFSGREAIRYIIRDLDIKKNKKISILPSFTCHTVINEFVKEGFQVVYYDVDLSLKVAISYINEMILKYNPDVLLLQPHFGFDTIILDEELNTTPYLILDMTQNYFNNQQYDKLCPSYKIASLRKWGPLVDGAIAEKVCGGNFKEYEILETNYSIYNLGKESQTLRYEYLNYGRGSKNTFLELQHLYSVVLSNKKQISLMTEESKSIFNSIDINKLKKRRKENYQIMLKYNWERLGTTIFKEAGESEIPLYFPVILDKCNRDEFLKFMYKNKIYPAIIWSKSIFLDNVLTSEEIEYIYYHIVAFPIDQRYSTTEISAVLNILDKFKTVLK